MKQARRPHAPRARAVAIAAERDERLIALIHFLLAMMTPLLLMALTGCKNYEGEAVDYGPEAAPEEIDSALGAPLEGVDPLKTKVGAFVHFSTIQSLAGGQVNSLLSDTGQTVVNREDYDEGVVYSIVEHKLVYGGNSEPQKSSTDFQIGFAKPSAQTAQTARTSSVATLALPKTFLTQLSASARELAIRTNASAAALLSSSDTRVTFHRLATRVADEPPPPMVAQQPGCLGIPNCTLKTHHVEFDQVVWGEDGQGERIHFDLAMSQDAPMLTGLHMSPLFNYYPGLLKSCVTLLVPVGGDGHSKTLLTECNEVENFRFELAPQ